jgi:TM2 domain-containing membrane protein YozV
VLGGDGSEGRTAKLVQSTPSTTWTFDHYLGERFPSIEVFNNNGFVIIPTNIEAVDITRLIVTFSSPQTGYVTATVGGGLPTISGSYDGRVLAVEGTSPVWKTDIVSGSLQIAQHGFTTTGSNRFNGNQTITGSLTITNTKMGSLCTTSTGDTVVLDLSDFDGATIDYVVKYSGNRRFGTIMGVWDGANHNSTETSTMDIGNTEDITFNIDASGNLHAVSSLYTWEITLSYRALGC